MPKLTAYRLRETSDLLIRPASPRREWMDQTTRKFAYRCLPLTIANQYGWEMLCPCAFEAVWTGGPGLGAVTVVRLGDGDERLPSSHFGEGVLTFHVDALFRTEQPYNLYVTGPVNGCKDGLVPLTGVVETNWLPFTFTMNWRFTRVGVPVRFEKGEPFCQFFPVLSILVEEVQPEWHHMDDEPGLREKLDHWTESRNAHNRDLNVPGSEAAARGWQRFYNHGISSIGTADATGHRTRLHVPPFAPLPDRAPDAAPVDVEAVVGCPFASERTRRNHAEVVGTPA